MYAVDETCYAARAAAGGALWWGGGGEATPGSMTSEHRVAAMESDQRLRSVAQEYVSAVSGQGTWRWKVPFLGSSRSGSYLQPDPSTLPAAPSTAAADPRPKMQLGQNRAVQRFSLKLRSRITFQVDATFRAAV
jgi:hypothetical protein